jgi:hypothetical protein
MPRLRSGAMLLLAASVVTADARAQSVELVAVRDTMLVETAAGNLSNGAGEYFFAGNTGQPDSLNTRRGLLSFDVAGAVPPGSTITGVTLQLFVSRAASSSFLAVSLHRVLGAWGEGDSQAIAGEGVGAPAAEGDATWLYRFYDVADPAGSPAWTTPGGDFVPEASGSRLVGGAGQFYVWESTPQLVADVQAWLDDPSSNHGWIVLGDESGPATAKRFNSRQFDGSPTRLPRLLVEFEAGSPSGACCLPEVICEIRSEAECLAAGGTWAGAGTSCADEDNDGVADVCETCPIDIDGSGAVDFNDLLLVLSNWGDCGPPCPEDLDGSGVVDFTDLLTVLAAFGPC